MSDAEKKSALIAGVSPGDKKMLSILDGDRGLGISEIMKRGGHPASVDVLLIVGWAKFDGLDIKLTPLGLAVKKELES